MAGYIEEVQVEKKNVSTWKVQTIVQDGDQLVQITAPSGHSFSFPEPVAIAVGKMVEMHEPQPYEVGQAEPDEKPSAVDVPEIDCPVPGCPERLKKLGTRGEYYANGLMGTGIVYSSMDEGDDVPGHVWMSMHPSTASLTDLFGAIFGRDEGDGSS